MHTFHIHFEGQVQGVGFRPHVYRLALKYRLKGWVSNGVDGVHILATGHKKSIFDFYHDLKANYPQNAVVKNDTISEESGQAFSDFRIKESLPSGNPNLLLTPDLGICQQCKNDLWDPQNRRFQYAFITCLHCGPRYSIMEGLPYDRPLTSMKDFGMCMDCEYEYGSPLDRRFYSQTNSCPACPVSLFLLDANGRPLSDESPDIIEAVTDALRLGKIVAVKGIGGYLLMADATNETAIRNLRERKNRPSKPFALLYPDESVLNGDVWVNEEALEEWRSIESPIVLFRLKQHPESGIIPHLIAPGLDAMGIMQPYAPVLELLAAKFGKPLVATSGNISGAPIFYENGKAIKNLGMVADFFLTNDRPIVVPQDDSVVGFSEKENQRVVFRRSRGFAPNFFQNELNPDHQNILCMGAMLKSTFSIQKSGNIYLSQYIGNTQDYDVQSVYKKVARHLTDILQFKPEYIVVDKHPDYFSTLYGEQLAGEFEIPCLKVQHHKAHFAAVLAENGQLHSGEPVLGVIWDGTGYGDDGNIWGGEFFIYQKNQFQRAAHFEYFNHFLGDKMAKEPRVSALAIAHHIPGADHFLKPKFTKNAWALYEKYLLKNDLLKTSSAGRLFDAVASLLDICDHQTFEGEAAMRLQAIAQAFYRKEGSKIRPYAISAPSPKNILKAVIGDLNKAVPKGEIAAKFHLTLVKVIRRVAEKLQVTKIAFSGGVFQNTLLIDLIIGELKNEFQLFFHQNLSPNDENIALGQLVYATLELDYLAARKTALQTN